jgi:hypothetical protein
MATNFPTSLDTLTNPTSSDSLSSPSHSSQHANVNDAVEALQAKVGADSSAVTSSHDYLIADHASRLTTLEGASGGKILQVVTATYSTSESTTSSTYVDTSLAATITPSATTSKILAIASVPQAAEKSASYNSGSANLAIERGGSQLVTSRLRYYSNQATAFRNIHSQISLVYLDSPATTSATTYTVQHKQSDSGASFVFFASNVGTLTLLEVAA